MACVAVFCVWNQVGHAQSGPPGLTPPAPRVPDRWLDCSYDSLCGAEGPAPISTGRYVTGGVVGTIYGFGIGHAIQGRYVEEGWKYTAGQAVGFTAMAVGLGMALGECFEPGCDNNDNYDALGSALALGGGVFYVASRVFEIVDLWSAEHGSRRRAPRYNLTLAPGAGGAQAGLSLSF